MDKNIYLLKMCNYNVQLVLQKDERLLVLLILDTKQVSSTQTKDHTTCLTVSAKLENIHKLINTVSVWPFPGFVSFLSKFFWQEVCRTWEELVVYVFYVYVTWLRLSLELRFTWGVRYYRHHSVSDIRLNCHEVLLSLIKGKSKTFLDIVHLEVGLLRASSLIFLLNHLLDSFAGRNVYRWRLVFFCLIFEYGKTNTSSMNVSLKLRG